MQQQRSVGGVGGGWCQGGTTPYKNWGFQQHKDCIPPVQNDGATTGRGESFAVYCGDGVYVDSVAMGECTTVEQPVTMTKGQAVRLCHLARKVGFLSWVVDTAAKGVTV